MAGPSFRDRVKQVHDMGQGKPAATRAAPAVEPLAGTHDSAVTPVVPIPRISASPPIREPEPRAAPAPPASWDIELGDLGGDDRSRKPAVSPVSPPTMPPRDLDLDVGGEPVAAPPAAARKPAAKPIVRTREVDIDTPGYTTKLVSGYSIVYGGQNLAGVRTFTLKGPNNLRQSFSVSGDEREFCLGEFPSSIGPLKITLVNKGRDGFVAEIEGGKSGWQKAGETCTNALKAVGLYKWEITMVGFGSVAAPAIALHFDAVNHALGQNKLLALVCYEVVSIGLAVWSFASRKKNAAEESTK